jgi:hypothetical protein
MTAENLQPLTVTTISATQTNAALIAIIASTMTNATGVSVGQDRTTVASSSETADYAFDPISPTPHALRAAGSELRSLS